MITIKKLFCVYFFVLFISCAMNSQENPAEMFIELYEKYEKTSFEKLTVDSNLNDGMGMYLFDIDKKISEDIFCQVNMYATMGQTQYLVYKKADENIWYFHKKALFYETPYGLKNAEIQNTYFKYANDKPYAFNVATGKYDIQADTNKYQAVVDVRSLTRLIEIVQNAISRM
jgi:hypothetical protein